MRLTLICGLDHIESEGRAFEAARILTDLAEKVRTQDVQDKDTFILRDINGNRVGVADVTDN